MKSSESFKVITLESSFLFSLVFITSTNARCLVVTQVLQIGHTFLSRIKEALHSLQNGKCPQFRRYEAVGDLKQLWQIKWDIGIVDFIPSILSSDFCLSMIITWSWNKDASWTVVISRLVNNSFAFSEYFTHKRVFSLHFHQVEKNLLVELSWNKLRLCNVWQFCLVL